jgi:hypothetical protein
MMINEPKMAPLSDLRKAFLATLIILAASLLLGACAPMDRSDPVFYGGAGGGNGGGAGTSGMSFRW